MFKNIKKNLLTIATLAILLIPGFIYADTFTSDSSLEVFPTNETLVFQGTTNQKITESFSIKNTSDVDKTIYIRTLPNNNFEYLGSSYINVQANSSSHISLQFQSSTTGTFTSQIILQHNDTLESKTIKLTANIYESDSNKGITLSSSNINFETQPTNTTTTSTFRIHNNNSHDINISTSDLNQPFKIISAPNKISANKSAPITIEFTPTTKNSSYKQTLTISTSDPKNQTLNIKVSGKSSQDTTTNSKIGSLTLSNKLVTFNNVDTKTSQSKTITITNPNSFDVQLKIPSNIKKPFKTSLQNSVNQTTIIKANSSKRLTITFEPTQKQFYEQDIIISTNLKNNPTYSIQVQANSIYRNNSSNSNSQNSNTQNTNNSNKVPFTPPTYNPNSYVKTTRDNLNPDLGQIAYFHVNLGNEFEKQGNQANLQIIDNKLNKIIYTQSARNLNQGLNNWKLKWNGKNNSDNSVLAGNYTYKITLVSKTRNTRSFQGNLTVVRNTSHIPKVVEQAPPTQHKHCLSYTDVNYDTNLCDSIIFAKDQDLLKKGENKFYPNQKVTRAQALSSLVKLFDLEMETYNPNQDSNLGFKDLETEEWIMPFIKTIQKYDTKNMILHGYTNANQETEFKPEQEINRAEFYKWMFEIANLTNQEENNYLMDYYITKAPFKDTNINSDYDWFTPYADLTRIHFNNSNFTKRYFNTYQITPYSTFCPDHQITKKEYFETLYELHKTNTVSFQ